MVLILSTMVVPGDEVWTAVYCIDSFFGENRRNIHLVSPSFKNIYEHNSMTECGKNII